MRKKMEREPLRINTELTEDRFYFEYGVWRPERKIHISDIYDEESNTTDINYYTQQKFFKAIEILEKDNKKPITIVLSTYGGNWYEGIAIYDRIKQSKCHSTICVYGPCMSMGSMIFQAGDIRLISENSVYMIHNIYHFVDGSRENVKEYANFIKYIEKTVLDIYYDALKKKHFKKKKKRLPLKK